MYRQACLLILVMVYAVDGFAQKPFKVYVLDGYTGAPIQGAWTKTLVGEDTLYTNHMGKVSDFENSEAFFFRVGKEGYISDTIFWNKKKYYRVYLHRNLKGLSETSVSSEFIGNSKLTTPLYGHRLDQGTLYTFDGLQTSAIVNTIPGVQWEQQGIAGNAKLSVRGNGWNDNSRIRGTRIYYENIPLTSADGMGLSEMVDPYFFSTMEFFKAPSSSAYGGYSGGSLVLKGKVPTEYGLTFDLGLTAGSNRLMRAQARGAYTDRTLSVSLGGMSMVHKGYRQQEYVNRKLYDAKVNWFLGGNHSLSFVLFYGLSNRGLPGGITQTEADTNRRMANPYSLGISARTENEFVRTGLTYTARSNTGFVSELTVFGNWTDYLNPYGTSVLNQGIKKAKIGGGGLRHVMRAEHGKKIRWRGNFGYEYQAETWNGNESVNLGGNVGALKYSYKLRSHHFFAFAQNSLDLPRNMVLDFGTVLAANALDKLDYVSANSMGKEDEVSLGAYPYVGLTKTIREKYAVYLRYNNGYKTPSINERLAPDGMLNTNLKNERSHQFEVGTRGQVLDGKLSWAVAGYAQLTHNHLVPYISSQTLVLHYGNGGSSRQFGMEVEVDWHAYENVSEGAALKKMWLGARYTFMDSRFVKYSEFGTDYGSMVTPGTPSNKFTILYAIHMRYGFSLNLDLGVRDKVWLDYANTKSVPAVFKGNFRVAWSGKVFSVLLPELFLGVNNFTGTKDFSFIYANSSDGRYLSPEQGFFIYGGVNLRTASFFNKKKQ